MEQALGDAGLLQAEHDEMESLLGQLERYLAGADPGGDVGLLLGRLIGCATAHFRREEGLMALCPSYGGATAHRLAHSQFLLRLERLAELLFLAGELSPDMPRMMDAWWRRHGGGADHELAEHLERQFAACRQAAE
jgi:hemerythrin